MSQTEPSETSGSTKKQPRTGVLKSVRSWLDQYRDKNPQSYIAAKRAAGGILIADAIVGLENPFDGRTTRPGLWSHLKTVGVVAVFCFIWYFAIGNITQMMDVPKSHTQSVQGSITTVEYNGASGKSTCVLEYVYTPEGTVEVMSGRTAVSTSAQCAATEGQPANVLYDPANTHQSTLDENFGFDFNRFLMIFKLAPLLIALGAIGSIIGIIIDIAQIIIGAILLRSASKDAKKHLDDGFDSTQLVEELKEQLVPMVLLVKSGMRGAVKAFRGKVPTASSLQPSPVVDAEIKRDVQAAQEPVATPTVPADTPAAPPQSTPTDQEAREYAEYQEFKRWQKLKKNAPPSDTNIKW